MSRNRNRGWKPVAGQDALNHPFLRIRSGKNLNIRRALSLEKGFSQRGSQAVLDGIRVGQAKNCFRSFLQFGSRGPLLRGVDPFLPNGGSKKEEIGSGSC